MADKHPYLEKFLSEGGASLTDREFLILLLSYCSRTSPEKAADRLLSVYGSFSAIADSDPKLLSHTLPSVDAAVLFRLISRLSAVCAAEESNILRLRSPHDAKLYFSGLFTGVSEERMIIASADRSFRITAAKTLYSGSPLRISVICRDIADFVVSVGAERIFIAHNHPMGTSEPSAADISSTEKMIAALTKLGTTVTDHIITGKNGTFSMREENVCSALSSQPLYGYKCETLPKK